MFCDFSTDTHAKWILVGEHAVLRKHGALVFPVPKLKFTLTYKTSSSGLSAEGDGSNGSEMRLLFWNVLERGSQLLGKSLNCITGHFHLSNHIPAGVGLGASAALCVAVGRWFVAQQLLEQDSLLEFAKNLENLFHGRSSGLDIAGVASSGPIYFKEGKFKPIELAWKPNWTLSSCGQIGMTSHCIEKVNQLWQQDEALGQAIDEDMESAVHMALNALQQDAPESLDQLTKAIQLGNDCFQRWGLVNENLQHHMQCLLEEGALAVKPTGSGSGGHVISLWQSPVLLQTPALMKI